MLLNVLWLNYKIVPVTSRWLYMSHSQDFCIVSNQVAPLIICFFTDSKNMNNYFHSDSIVQKLKSAKKLTTIRTVFLRWFLVKCSAHQSVYICWMLQGLFWRALQTFMDLMRLVFTFIPSVCFYTWTGSFRHCTCCATATSCGCCDGSERGMSRSRTQSARSPSLCRASSLPLSGRSSSPVVRTHFWFTLISAWTDRSAK